MGRRECGSEIRQVRWLHRGMVDMHRVDDIHCGKLPGMNNHLQDQDNQFDETLIPDYCKLHRLPIGCLGSQLSRWDWKRQYQMARLHLGHLRVHPRPRCCNQLSPAPCLFYHLPSLHLLDDVGFCSVHHLVAYRRFQHLRLQVSIGGVHHEV